MNRKSGVVISLLTAFCVSVGVLGVQAATKPLKYPLDIKFDVNKTDIKVNPQTESEFKKLSHELSAYPYAKVEIEGYADETGPAEYNDKLSTERAEAVRQMLIKNYQVPSDRIHAVGLGERRPSASNETAQGRRENRRVIATIYRLEPDKTGPEGSRL